MRAAPLAAALLLAPALAAQGPVFDPDDFVDPRQHEGPVIISRLAAGVVLNPMDQSRPMHQNVGFVHLANSIYGSNFQLDFKHTETAGVDAPEPVHRCDCPPDGPVDFPTPPLPDATPASPPPGRRETLQLSWYRRAGPTAAGIPAMLRTRVTISQQQIATEIVAAATGATTWMHGRERTYGLDADTHVHVRGRDFYGALFYTRTERTGTTGDRSQQSLVYMHRPPAISWGDVMARVTLGIGTATGRGTSGINLVHPAFEAFWRHSRSRVGVHLVWTPQITRSGADGWRTTHQIALFAERALYVKLFRNERDEVRGTRYE